MLLNILAVGAGGCIGSVLRYLITLIKVDENFIFPIKTLCINILGCFFIGIVAGLALNNSSLDDRLVLFLKVGLCGGFTTLSAFAIEFSDLYKSGNEWLAILYAILTLCISVLAVFSGEHILSST